MTPARQGTRPRGGSAAPRSPPTRPEEAARATEADRPPAATPPHSRTRLARLHRMRGGPRARPCVPAARAGPGAQVLACSASYAFRRARNPPRAWAVRVAAARRRCGPDSAASIPAATRCRDRTSAPKRGKGEEGEGVSSPAAPARQDEGRGGEQQRSSLRAFRLARRPGREIRIAARRGMPTWSALQLAGDSRRKERRGPALHNVTIPRSRVRHHGDHARQNRGSYARTRRLGERAGRPPQPARPQSSDLPHLRGAMVGQRPTETPPPAARPGRDRPKVEGGQDATAYPGRSRRRSARPRSGGPPRPLAPGQRS